MDIFNKIAFKIIKEQGLIIGPLAWSEAKKVPGFSIVDLKQGTVSLVGNQQEIIDNLVAQYERLFGRASHEVCKDAVRDLITELPQDQIPSSLR